MIIGVFIRGFKVFSGMQYIPLVGDDNALSIMIGDNGIGKSTVLEALDFFFGGRNFITNKSAKKGSRGANIDGVVAPVFLINDDELKGITEDEKRLMTAYNRFIRSHSSVDSALRNQLKRFSNNDYSAILLSRYRNDSEHDSIPFAQELMKKQFVQNASDYGLSNDDFLSKREGKLSHHKVLREKICKTYEYIYLPVEGNEEHFVQLESKPLMALAGINFEKAVGDAMGTEATKKKIIASLQKFINDIDQLLDGYRYKDKTQTKFNKQILLKTIIEKYLATKTLHKIGRSERDNIPFENLSAGEKTRAILHLCRVLLENKQRGQLQENIIIGIDEPEASLHAKHMFGQFESLRQISKNCQMIVTSHWYGFMPVLDSGWVQSFTGENQDFNVDTLDLSDFQQQIRNLRTKTAGTRPADIMLKADSEFRLSIIHSVCLEKPYNWIICEGITDAMYLKCLIGDKSMNSLNIKIVPVAGIKKVFGFYKKLYPEINDHKENVKGKIICLIDTDNALPNPDGLSDSAAEGMLWFKRLHNNDEKAHLLNLKEPIVSQPTSIEDVLPSQPFINALKQLDDDLPFDLESSVSENASRLNSYYALSLREEERREFKEFFREREGGRKLQLAKAFCKEYDASKDGQPDWITEIIKIFNKDNGMAND